MEKEDTKYETGFLFSKCNFWRGIGSVLNVPGNYYEFNSSKTEEEADNRALTSDWIIVGQDIKNAQKKFESKNHKELCLK